MFVARDRALKPGQQIVYTTAELSDQKSEDLPLTTGEALFLYRSAEISAPLPTSHCSLRIRDAPMRPVPY
jgi:hypothetical protein